MKTAVFGASGFVGTQLVENLWAKGRECVPVIHSAGSAWRLARHGRPLSVADILSRNDVARVMQGCTHVVNCTRGSDDVMIEGLKVLLAEAKAQGVKRFVHLSSVAVYGDPPPLESAEESAAARPERGSYGELKLRQDRLVGKAHEKGLSCAVLCPPNISGLYSSFVTNVLEDIRNASLRLIDRGARPINVVDVENLCHAIELACDAEKTDGRRIFVTDGEGVTWRRFVDELWPLAEQTAPLPDMSEGDVKISALPARASLWRAMKHLASSDVRAALRKDPLLERLDKAARGAVAHLPGNMELGLQHAIEGPRKIVKVVADEKPASRYVAQQLRHVTHSNKRARGVLNYEPLVSFEQSMANFRRWFIETRALFGPSWRLARDLYN